MRPSHAEVANLPRLSLVPGYLFKSNHNTSPNNFISSKNFFWSLQESCFLGDGQDETTKN